MSYHSKSSLFILHRALVGPLSSSSLRFSCNFRLHIICELLYSFARFNVQKNRYVKQAILAPPPSSQHCSNWSKDDFEW